LKFYVKTVAVIWGMFLLTALPHPNEDIA